MADDDLRDFEAGTFTHEGETKIVLRKGSGPAVIVIAEMPGISPRVADFARKVADIGCTAVMPHLFGNPGQSVDPKADGWLRTSTYMASSMFRGCVSREFTVLATGKTSPVINWLRALAQNEHERNGGPGVGAIGMCFTGDTRWPWRQTTGCSHRCCRSPRYRSASARRPGTTSISLRRT